MESRTNKSTNSQEIIWLDSIAVNGFKSLKHIEVPLSPITVLLGGNSSGKSSIMQSILLASQNLANPTDFRFDLNGVAVTLGTYKEVLHKGFSEDKQLDLKFNFAGTSTLTSGGSITSITYTLNTPKVEDDLRKSSIAVASCALEVKTPAKKKTRLVSIPISAGKQNTHSENVSALSMQGTIQRNLTSLFDIRNPGDLRSRMISRTAKTTASAPVIEIFMNLQPRARSFSGSFFPVPQFSQNTCRVELFIQIIGMYFTLKTFHTMNSENKHPAAIKGDIQPSSRVFYQHFNRTLSARQDIGRLVDRARKILNSKPKGASRHIVDLTHQEINLIIKLTDLHKRQKLEDASTNIENLYSELAANLDFDNLTESGLLKAFEQLNKTHYSKAFMDLTFSSLPAVRALYEPSVEHASEIESSLVNYLGSSVHYLGPLRAHSLIDQSGWSPRSTLIPFGSKGENLGKVLDSPESRIRSIYPLPPKGSDKSKATEEKVSLISALNAWVAWFDLGKTVGVDDQAAWGTHLELDKEKMFQKGTGVSQILPVIALSLTALPGSTVMIEQPELHLHPALQQRLGTFFALLSKTGRRFIVETHSEYLVTRLRREVAVGKIEAKDLGLLFVKKKRAKNGDTFTEIAKAPVSVSGIVPVWPQGFFDFTNEDKLDIRLAQSKLAK